MQPFILISPLPLRPNWRPLLVLHCLPYQLHCLLPRHLLLQLLLDVLNLLLYRSKLLLRGHLLLHFLHFLRKLHLQPLKSLHQKLNPTWSIFRLKLLIHLFQFRLFLLATLW